MLATAAAAALAGMAAAAPEPPPAGIVVVTGSADDMLAEVVRLAEARRVACIEYQKPGEWSNARRTVEPYRLQERRSFRLDRISSVRDGGDVFEPRIPITLGAGEVTAFEWGHEPAVTLGPGAEYFNFLETVMLDGTVTEDELAKAKALGGSVGLDERRGVHARVFANVLAEVLQDSAVTGGEAEYLGQVRCFLGLLGWAP